MTVVMSGTAVDRLPASTDLSLRVLMRALRVRQWTKNALLFAGLLFAAKLDDPGRWGEAIVAFAAYCAASSAAYLVNDVNDAERDRLHPTKCRRPVASGQMSQRSALLLAAALAAAALVAAATLGWPSLILLAAFVGLQLAYSFRLKHAVLVDVATIATLFVIRSGAGAEAVGVRISPWLLACTALLALFLALAKRRVELDLPGSSTGARRAVLAHYTGRMLDRSLGLVAHATVATYSGYAFQLRSAGMPLTIPFVALAVGRYLQLMGRGLGEEPEEILLSDQPMLALIAGWALVAAVVLVGA
jgi:4-hydroxybenzoate polyprenyltransferase